MNVAKDQTHEQWWCTSHKSEFSGTPHTCSLWQATDQSVCNMLKLGVCYKTCFVDKQRCKWSL